MNAVQFVDVEAVRSHLDVSTRRGRPAVAAPRVPGSDATGAVGCVGVPRQ